MTVSPAASRSATIASEAGAFADEQGDETGLVHDAAQALCLCLQVEGHFRQIEAVDVLHLLVHHETIDEFRAVDRLYIGAGGGGGEPAAMAAHHFMHDKRLRRGALFVADIVEEAGAVFGGRPGAE